MATMIDNFIQASWNTVIESWPYSDRLLWVVGTTTMHLAVWYLSNMLLYLVYHFNLFPQYKIQGSKWPDRDLVISCLKSNTFTHFMIQPFSLYFIGYPAFNYFGGADLHAPVPSIFTFMWQIPFFFVANDALFYWVHRALHHPLIYKHIHKQHHMFKQPIGIATEYAHPVEAVFANEIPTLIGPLLLGAHPAVFWAYLVLRMWETIDSHSGFRFPWSPWNMIPFAVGGSEFHDFHHSVNIGNYGMLRFWDWATGTDARYRQHLLKSKSNNTPKAA